MAGRDEVEFSIAKQGDSLAESERSPLQTYCLAMQPICDAQLRHVSDELLYRHSASAGYAQIIGGQDMLATARVCELAFYEIGIDRLAANRRVFLNVPYGWLLNPQSLPQHPDRLVVEVLENVAVNAEVLAALRMIRAMGFEIALDDFVLTPHTQPLLEIAHIVKVDVQQPFDEQVVAYYKRSGLRLLAEKVEDMASFEQLRKMGFELFQGYFYAYPENRQGVSRDRHNNRVALFRLIHMLEKDNHHVKDIARTIAQDARLTFVLLRYANSAFFHYRGSVKTVFQALHVLGLQQVRNIVLTMLIANNGPTSRMLLARALTRASMCERLAGTIGEDADSAFLIGMLSMMGQLLGRELAVLLKEMALSGELVEVILSRKGQLGLLLLSVERFENAELHDWSATRIEMFNWLWLDSQVWATEVLAMVDGG